MSLEKEERESASGLGLREVRALPRLLASSFQVPDFSVRSFGLVFGGV